MATIEVSEEVIAKLLKEVDAAREVTARVEKLENLLSALAESGLVKQADVKKSLGATAASVLKSARPAHGSAWTPRLDFASANKARVEKASGKTEELHPLTDKLADIRKRL